MPNKIYIFLVIIIFFSCKKKNEKTTNIQKNKQITPQDNNPTVYMSNKDTIFYEGNTIKKYSHTDEWNVGFRVKEKTIESDITMFKDYFYNKTISIKNASLSHTGYVHDFYKIDLIRAC